MEQSLMPRMPHRLCLISLGLMLALSGCGLIGGQADDPAAPEATPPSQSITIAEPQTGAIVNDPIAVSGTLNRAPAEGSLSATLFDSQEQVVGQSELAVAEDNSFNGFVSFSQVPAEGMLRLDIADLNVATGVPFAVASVELEPGPAAVPQNIAIETPPPGTEVGSPVVITGQLTRTPIEGLLTYQIIDVNANTQLGTGTFPVADDNSFVASIEFTLPPAGGPIRAEIFEQDPASGQRLAGAGLDLAVAGSDAGDAAPPPDQQLISFTSPPPFTQVGSPVVVTGSTARFPFEGNLNYTITGPDGATLGSGFITVQGEPGAPGTFNASIDFNPPPDGGQITLRVFEIDQANGREIASSSLDLLVGAAAPPAGQVINISSPPPGTVVGSPVVITGSTTQFPAAGNLNYRILDANGNELGSGSFPVEGAPGGPASFTASLEFNLPAGGGPITVQIIDADPASGEPIAQANLDLNVAP